MFLTTLALTVSFALPPQDTKPAPLDLSRAMPKDAWVFVSLREIDGLRADFEKHAARGLYMDPESAGLRGWFEEALAKEASSKDEKSARVQRLALDFLDSVHGSMALCVTPPTQGSEPDVLFLVDPGTPRAGFEKVFDEFLENMNKETVATTITYEGVELHVSEDKHSDAAKGDSAKGMSAGVLFDAGSFAGLSITHGRERAVELVQVAIDHLHGKDQDSTIAANPRYLESKSGVSARGRLELFADLQGFLPAVLAKEAPRTDERQLKVLEAFGLTQFGWSYLTADIGAGEAARIEFALALPEKGLLRSLFELLGQLPTNAARAFPKESQGVSLYSLDVPGLWKWIFEVMKQVSPESGEQTEAQITAMGQAFGGIDLEKDVIAQLTGEFGSNMIDVPAEEWMEANGIGGAEEGDEEGAAGEEPMSTPAIEPPKGTLLGSAWWIGLRDAKAFRGTLENVLDATGASEELETEEFQGLTIWSMPLPTGAALAFAFTSKGLVISTYPTALRAVLRMDGAQAKDSVLERDSFKPLFAEHRDAGVFSATNTASLLKTLWGVLDLAANRMPPLRAGGMTDLAEADNPLRHLPPAEVIDKHFQGTATTAMRRKGNVLQLRMSMR